MKYLAFILNLLWTVLGLLASLASLPIKVGFSRSPLAIVIHVRSFWWLTWLPWYRGARAMANGHVVRLGPEADLRDLQHELVHVEQSLREPLIHPLLYTLEWLRRGYRKTSTRKRRTPVPGVGTLSTRR